MSGAAAVAVAVASCGCEDLDPRVDRIYLASANYTRRTSSVKSSLGSSWVRLGWPTLILHTFRAPPEPRGILSTYVTFAHVRLQTFKTGCLLLPQKCVNHLIAYVKVISDLLTPLCPESYPANIVRRASLLATIWIHFKFSCTEYSYSLHFKLYLCLSFTQTL